MSSDSEGHLEWERRRAPAAAAAAFGAGLFTIAGLVIQIALIGERGDGDRGQLVWIDENAGAFYASLGTQVLSVALVAGALAYLLRATVARRPEVPRFILPLLLLVPVLTGLGGLLAQIDILDIADRFVSGRPSEERAGNLLEDRNQIGPFLGFGGYLALALSFVFVSLNAMRAGLLSRFMGIIGIFVGALLVLPLVPGGQAFIQLYWIVALGLLFLGRWPGGRGPAWDASEAIPWPSAQQRRDEVAAGAVPVDDPRDPPPEPPDGDETQRDPHPISRKRSRKRRR